MTTSRLGRVLASVCLLGGVLLTACGDETAPAGATISGPADVTIDVAPLDDPPATTLTFAVIDANGNPVPGVDIEFFAFSSATGGSSAALTDENGGLLNPANPTNVILQTDDRGLGRVRFVIGFSTACASPPATPVDLEATGIVGASVGVASAQWTGTYNVKCT